MKLDSTNRYIVHIKPQAAGYSQTQLADLYRSIEAQLHAIPGVEKVGLCSYTLMEDNNNGTDIRIEGRPQLDLQTSDISVGPEYFYSAGICGLIGVCIV